MSARPVATPGAAILQVDDLHKRFTLSRRGLWGREQDAFVHAVDGVSFELARGEVLALVGESGCGKSTLALTLLGLEDPTSGSIRFEGAEITHQPPAAMKQVRRHMQMIFQDPYESLNPLMNVGDIVAEPLKVHGLAKERSERRARVIQALEDAGLKPAERFLAQLPHELSGGQRQRVVIAAALVLEPTLLLADEPVSMLDVSIRAEILNLLAELRTAQGISILFITHDLGTVGALADRVAVMYLSHIIWNSDRRNRCSKTRSIRTRARCSRSCPCPIRACATNASFSAARRPTRSTCRPAAAFIHAVRWPRSAVA
ncbi:MAG: dipeptide/oligopeptide/nickel ABC transporter ATP-binding protein [Caldilineaceae bacterium]